MSMAITALVLGSATGLRVAERIVKKVGTKRAKAIMKNVRKAGDQALGIKSQDTWADMATNDVIDLVNTGVKEGTKIKKCLNSPDKLNAVLQIAGSAHKLYRESKKFYGAWVK